MMFATFNSNSRILTQFYSEILSRYKIDFNSDKTFCVLPLTTAKGQILVNCIAICIIPCVNKKNNRALSEEQATWKCQLS